MFKVGDIVIAIKSSAGGSYIKGEKYIVKFVDSSNWVYTKKDSKGNTENAFYAGYFKLYKKYKKAQPSELEILRKEFPHVYRHVKEMAK